MCETTVICCLGVPAEVLQNVPGGWVRYTIRSGWDRAQSSISRVVDQFGAWNIVGEKGLHPSFKQIRVHGIGEFMSKIYAKGNSSPLSAHISHSPRVYFSGTRWPELLLPERRHRTIHG